MNENKKKKGFLGTVERVGKKDEITGIKEKIYKEICDSYYRRCAGCRIFYFIWEKPNIGEEISSINRGGKLNNGYNAYCRWQWDW